MLLLGCFHGFLSHTFVCDEWGGKHFFEVISDGDSFNAQSAAVETGANHEAFERRSNPLFITMASHRLEGKETVQGFASRKSGRVIKPSRSFTKLPPLNPRRAKWSYSQLDLLTRSRSSRSPPGPRFTKQGRIGGHRVTKRGKGFFCVFDINADPR